MASPTSTFVTRWRTPRGESPAASLVAIRTARATTRRSAAMAARGFVSEASNLTRDSSRRHRPRLRARPRQGTTELVSRTPSGRPQTERACVCPVARWFENRVSVAGLQSSLRRQVRPGATGHQSSSGRVRDDRSKRRTIRVSADGDEEWMENSRAPSLDDTGTCSFRNRDIQSTGVMRPMTKTCTYTAGLRSKSAGENKVQGFCGGSTGSRGVRFDGVLTRFQVQHSMFLRLQVPRGPEPAVRAAGRNPETCGTRGTEPCRTEWDLWNPVGPTKAPAFAPALHAGAPGGLGACGQRGAVTIAAVAAAQGVLIKPDAT